MYRLSGSLWRNEEFFRLAWLFEWLNMWGYAEERPGEWVTAGELLAELER
jgi:hypothetical protein